MFTIRKFKTIAPQIFDVVLDFKNNGEDYAGFNDGEDEITYICDDGKIYVKMNIPQEELEICIYNKYADFPFAAVGIPFERIEGPGFLIESIKEEIELEMATYERMIDELEN